MAPAKPDTLEQIIADTQGLEMDMGDVNVGRHPVKASTLEDWKDRLAQIRGRMSVIKEKLVEKVS